MSTATMSDVNNCINNSITKENIGDFIRDYTSAFAEYIVDTRKSREDNHTQVRRYYDELIRLRDRVYSDENLKNSLPAVYIISSKAAYSKARGLLSNNFYKFIDKHIKDIKTIEDFDNFMLCFESIVGYMKFYETQQGGKSNNSNSYQSNKQNKGQYNNNKR